MAVILGEGTRPFNPLILCFPRFKPERSPINAKNTRSSGANEKTIRPKHRIDRRKRFFTVDTARPHAKRDQGEERVDIGANLDLDVNSNPRFPFPLDIGLLELYFASRRQ
jgi:hypothetical protein